MSWSQGSSGSIVSDYGPDDWEIGVLSPAGAKDFSSSHCVQTGSRAHPASCTMGTRGPFPGAKARPGVTLTTHPHLCRGQERVISPLSPSATMTCSGTALLFFVTRRQQWPGLHAISPSSRRAIADTTMNATRLGVAFP
jgi:hypothetical protein